MAADKVAAARRARKVADDAWLRAKWEAWQVENEARASEGYYYESTGFCGIDIDTVHAEDRPKYELAREKYLDIQEPFGHGSLSP